MYEMLTVWAAIFLCALIAELQNPGLFYFLSLSIGSGAALIAYSLCLSAGMQIITFVLASFVAVLFLQLVVRRNKSTGKHHRTNVEALIGKRGIVLENIEPLGVGQIKLEGEIWSARAVHGQSIVTGSLVEVASVVGCHLIVQQVKQ
jgi:membrane protein implicated in regulation of membrane protease activity